MRRMWKWLIAGVLGLALIAVAGPYVYTHFIEGPPPPRLTLPALHPSKAARSTTTSGASTPPAGTTGIDGAYTVGHGSMAGYRVTEVLVGQHTTAVGRTTKIWGSVTIASSRVTQGTFTVNMASVKSDQSGRNASFDGRIMDVTRFPTATLKLTQPIDVGTVPMDGSTATYQAVGQLTLHGVTRPVNFTLSAERVATGVYALADIHIVFNDWHIANPSIGGGFVTTASTGTLEVLVHLTKGQGNPADTGAGSTPGGGVAPTQVTVPSTTVPHLSIPSS